MVTRVLFACHGNICRSPVAEFVMKDLVRQAGLEAQLHLEPATSREEIGNPVYPPARCKLAEHGISCGDVADPWYTGDFETIWRDVLTGCQGLLRQLSNR